MSIDTLRERIPDAARDIRLNLGAVLSAEGAPDLNDTQRHLVALASAYATRNNELIAAIESTARETLDETHVQAARTAAAVMAMNNVYYRFLHLAGDAELNKLPARLRMNGLGNHGIAKLDFELMALAVSAINGCGMCIESHVHEVKKHGASLLAVQTTARIAAVIAAANQALELPV